VPSLLSSIGLKSVTPIKINQDLCGLTIITLPPIIPITPPAKPKDPVIKVKNPNLPPKVVTDLVPDEQLPPIEPTFDETRIINTGNASIGIETPNVQPTISKPTEPYISVEIMPAYEGGMEGLYSFLGNHLRYPSIDRRNGTEGTVYVQFVINETGNVTNIQVIRGLSNTLDEEAKRVISLMKKWKPGIQNHEAVSVKMVVPIKFKLTT
jgi:protein TonB